MTAPATAPTKVPNYATVHVQADGRTCWTGKGEKHFFRNTGEARDAVAHLRKYGALRASDAEQVLRQIAEVESRSGAGVGGTPSTFETVANSDGQSAVAVSNPAPTGNAEAPPSDVVDTPTPWTSARVFETIVVEPRPLTELKGQPKATEWLTNMGSKVLHHVALKKANKPSDVVLTGALVGPEGVGRRLAAELYTSRLHQQKAITEPLLHVIDLRRLLEDGSDLEKTVKSLTKEPPLKGVILLENAHLIDREEHMKELRVIEGLANGGGEPVLLLSGESELRGLLDSHWRIKDAMKTQVIFGPLAPEILTDIFLATAEEKGFKVDADGKAAAAGRFRSSGKAGGAVAKKLFLEAKDRLSLRLYPKGEMPDPPPSNDALFTLTAAELRTPSLGDIEKLPGIIRIDSRVGQDEAKAWARRIAYQIAADREAMARGEKVEPSNLNIIISGDQGTGKTTLYEYLNDVLTELGVRNGKVVYGTASIVKGSKQGEGEANVGRMYRDAEGGVVVFDEAHVWADDDLGHRTLKAMVPLALNNAFTTTTIVIGYEEPMKKLADIDPGYDRRFPFTNRLLLKPYDRDQLRDLVRQCVERMEYKLGPGAIEAAMAILDVQRNLKNFGNAGAAENLVKAAASFCGARKKAPGEDPRVLMPEDFGNLPQGIEAIVKKLDDYVGLGRFKEEFEALGHAVEDQRKNDLPVQDAFNPNALFVGPTGSGRKTMATVATEMYNAYGLLGTVKPVFKTLSVFKGKHLGDSENNVRDCVDRNIGGHLVLGGFRDLLENMDSYARGIISELKVQLLEKRGKLAVSLVGTADEVDAFLDADEEGVLRSLFGQRYELEVMTPTAASELLVKKLGMRKLHAEANARLTELMTRLATAKNWQSGIDVEILTRQILTEHSALARAERYAGWDRNTISLEALGTAVDYMLKLKGAKSSGEIWNKEPVSPLSPSLRNGGKSPK